MKPAHWISLCLCFAIFFALGLRHEPKSPGAPAPAHAAAPAAFIPIPLAAPSDFAQLEARFAAPYSAGTQEPGPAHQEATRRLMLLKAMKAHTPAAAVPAVPAVLKIYQRILRNPQENWAVKRQALQNALALASEMPEKTRERWIASAPKDLLAQAQKSESEILEEAVAHAR